MLRYWLCAPSNCCVSSPETRAGSPPSSDHVLLETPTKSCLFVAVSGAVGSFSRSPPVRKSLHPAAATLPASTSAVSARPVRRMVMDMVTLESPLSRVSAAERERQHERPRLRIVEVVQALREDLRAAEVRFGVESLVVRPDRQVAAGHAQVD